MGLSSLLDRALKQRKNILASFEMLRVFDGAGDGVPGLFIDKLGPVLLVHLIQQNKTSEKKLIESVTHLATFCARLYQVSSLYIRVHNKDPRATAKQDATLFHGESIKVITLSEGDLRFLIRPEANVNAGIFIDTRDLRQLLTATSKTLKVLNTFCFTGSLGIAAFTGGAREVVQVDVSQSALRWAKENLALNQSRGEGTMRFICEDCWSFLKREIRRVDKGQERYDLIILDPPSFGRRGGKAFSVERDLSELVALAGQLVTEQGRLIVTVNARNYLAEDILRITTKRLSQIHRKVVEAKTLAPPKDFTSPPQSSFSMRGVLVQLA